MQNTDRRERTLFRVRKVAIGVFYLLLAGGTLMIGLGAATGIIQYLIEGGVILVTSPIFLVMSMLARKKMQDLGT